MAGETRRVRFRAEWVEELPAGEAEFEEGDRRALPRELVVRTPGRPRHPTDDPTRSRVWVRAAADSAAELGLRGADLLVGLGDGLVSPGSAWLVTCSIHWRQRRGRDTVLKDDTLAHTSEDLGDALEALAEWAEARVVRNRRTDLGGHACLFTVEPGEEGDGRELLRAGTGNEKGQDAVLAMLQALAEEAERRYIV